MKLTPKDWQAIAQLEASDLLGTPDGAVKLCEAKRYGLLADEIERLRVLLRLAADEPNIDKARAIADRELHGPNEKLLATIRRMAACENIYTVRAIASVALHGLHETPNV